MTYTYAEANSAFSKIENGVINNPKEIKSILKDFIKSDDQGICSFAARSTKITEDLIKKIIKSNIFKENPRLKNELISNPAVPGKTAAKLLQELSFINQRAVMRNIIKGITYRRDTYFRLSNIRENISPANQKALDQIIKEEVIGAKLEQNNCSPAAYFYDSNKTLEKNNQAPVQGWKIHISAANIDDYENLLDTILPDLNRLGVNYKVVSPNKFAEQMMDPQQRGKAITIYPDKHFIYDKLSEQSKAMLNMDIGIIVPTDKFLGGRANARFGPYFSDCMIYPTGEVLPDIKNTKTYAPSFIDDKSINSLNDISNYYMNSRIKFNEITKARMHHEINHDEYLKGYAAYVQESRLGFPSDDHRFVMDQYRIYLNQQNPERDRNYILKEFDNPHRDIESENFYFVNAPTGGSEIIVTTNDPDFQAKLNYMDINNFSKLENNKNVIQHENQERNKDFSELDL